ncbi:hypothetical protein BO82DRAFT_402634 [Aspergillus uvarum CBS 121591]|uniref:Uncharacterized protein n=1 Tax=Aspergillus uvarum CBS 121591 TaxID=1448315 RepID=A0A319C800_9EURO|nr:hypothetical protein BO82DRAFT_402634 [Aspergillus uvarum CBS 121591]PYH81374.1 hypothetical protein BO82DRAFT_402634 [Aspergillus uvarum CBS 121591]
MKPTDIAFGLVTHAFADAYHDAVIPFPPPSNFKPPKEHAAVALLENILHHVIFPSDLYGTVHINSQDPPHIESSMKADITIKYTTHLLKIQSLIFIEAKRTKRNESYNTQTVEAQALDYCNEFFNNPANKCDFIYTCTLVGVHIRLWQVLNEIQRGKEHRDLIPLWGNPDRGSNNQYLNLGNNEHAKTILTTFRSCLQNAPIHWVGKSSSDPPVTATTSAIQLPEINPALATQGGFTGLPAMHPPLPNAPMRISRDGADPSTGSTTFHRPPVGYTKVTKFMPKTLDRYVWFIGTAHANSPSTAWTIRGSFLVNDERKVYADSTTPGLYSEIKLS